MVQLDIRIPMRDGVRLYGALYRPNTGDCFPVILSRTIYSTQHPYYVQMAQRFAAAGYGVLLVDSRGRYESDGVWHPYFCEVEDGYDTQQWLGAQPWCDGCIGTFGRSYVGYTQILPAHFRSPHVKALVPMANQEDNYGHMRVDGVLQLQNVMNFVWLGNRTNQTISHQGVIDMERLYRRLPLISALDDLAERPFYREIIQHECFDEFWQAYSLKGKYSQVESPAYFMTGWYDNLVHEGFKCFAGWTQQARSEHARRTTKLLVGPWPHNPMGSAEPFGDIDFGPHAALDLGEEHIRWFDQRIRSRNTGIDDEPPVRIFVMGENRWRSENEWPLERTEYTKFYLRSNGRANSLVGDGTLDTTAPVEEANDSYLYDPADPVPTWGGQSMFPQNNGPRDRRPIERRDDVLVYSTAPLEHDVEVTGTAVLELHASTSATDTDFIATLVDVHPNGKAIILTQGILRTRFRDSFERPTVIESNRPYALTIQLWETSNLFRTGHRIRLEITSSDFPRFDRNLNTGHQAGLDSEMITAQQTVYHDQQRPSCLVLPIIPR